MLFEKRPHPKQDALKYAAKHRCKSGACPECSDAAQRLFANAARRYLKGKSGVACVTIVPADGAVTPGGL